MNRPIPRLQTGTVSLKITRERLAIGKMRLVMAGATLTPYRPRYQHRPLKCPDSNLLSDVEEVDSSKRRYVYEKQPIRIRVLTSWTPNNLGHSFLLWWWAVGDQYRIVVKQLTASHKELVYNVLNAIRIGMIFPARLQNGLTNHMSWTLECAAALKWIDMPWERQKGYPLFS